MAQNAKITADVSYPSNDSCFVDADFSLSYRIFFANHGQNSAMTNAKIVVMK